MLSRHLLTSAQTFRVCVVIFAHHCGMPLLKATLRWLSCSYKLERSRFLTATKTRREFPYSSNSSAVNNVSLAYLCCTPLCERNLLQSTVDGMEFYNARSYERFWNSDVTSTRIL